MKTPKSINRPQLEHATQLSPLQLNALKISVNHTIITPDRFKKPSEPTSMPQVDGMEITITQ